MKTYVKKVVALQYTKENRGAFLALLNNGSCDGVNFYANYIIIDGSIRLDEGDWFIPKTGEVFSDHIFEEEYTEA